MPSTANQATMLERRGNTHTLSLPLFLSLSVLVLQLQADFMGDLISCVWYTKGDMKVLAHQVARLEHEWNQLVKRREGDWGSDKQGREEAQS
jgi:hypothetical protein